MAFENLSERLQNAIKMFRGSGKITEDDLKAPLREVRMALLEADVNFKVVKDFVANIKERALGETVQQSLTPGQQIIKIVNDELTQLLGGTQSKLTVADKPPTVIMLVGLQGAGKTTTAGKLGSLLRKKGKKPLLVAGDVYRPAAIKQLQVLGEQLSLPVFALGDQVSPVEIARKAMDKAFSLACDTVIIDTAGRLHINEELMDELRNIKATVNPHEILLVVDAMTGQDAVTVAESFNGELGIDGLIVTKLDGDSRGGAVLSVKAVTGRPVKFVGMGEKLDALEPFHPDRMASRILGMGDILSLIEKIQSTTDLAKAVEMDMAVKIRLKRMGSKKAPFYRIVVADSRSPRDGRIIESIGFYDSTVQPATVKIDEEKALSWMAKGAQPTDTVKNLFSKDGIMKKYAESKAK